MKGDGELNALLTNGQPCSGRVDGETIIVQLPEADTWHIEFARTGYYEVNLYNEADTPALPFQVELSAPQIAASHIKILEESNVKQYEVFELEFAAAPPQGSHAVVDLCAEFCSDGETVAVNGFYAGNGRYKVRFLPQKAGRYTWRVSGVLSASGEEDCAPHDPACHGVVRADGLHFRHDDGAWYMPFGTTVYALLHQKQSLVEQTMQTLSHAPFNKVRLCVFPKHFDYNNNEPELFPFERDGDGWDVDRPVETFWEHLELRLRQLNEMGVQADLILFHPYDHWGFAKLSKEQCLIYLDYAVRRLAAFPNLWWSLANEYDLITEFQLSWWAEFAAYLAGHDPYQHLISNHYCIVPWDYGNEHTTHCSIQDGGVQNVPKMQEKYGKPVIYDECGYEGTVPYGWGNLSAFELVNRFWVAVTRGGYCTHGETFLSPDEILWWSKGGILKGESALRIAFLREIAEALGQPLDWLEQGDSGVETIPEVAPGLTVTPQRWQEICDGMKQHAGHCGDRAYLYYYARSCTALATLDLPDTHRYRIEVIDVWEMTRNVALEGASGTVKITLPGKEGIAVLATAQ